VTIESESGRTDILAETEGEVEIENGTETEDLHGAMQDETMTIDRQGGTEICSMSEEEVADVEVAEEVTGMTLEVEAEESGRRVHLPHLRKRSQPRT
jgi:hypothetical protein